MAPLDSASLAGKQVSLPNLIGLIDGNFMVICWPMGLGTLHAYKALHSGKEGNTVWNVGRTSFQAVRFVCTVYGSLLRQVDGSQPFHYNVVAQHAQRNVEQAEAHVQQCHVAHSNCCQCGKWFHSFRWTTQLLQIFRELKLGDVMLHATCICVQLFHECTLNK